MRFLRTVLVHLLFWGVVAIGLWLIGGREESLNPGFMETASSRLQIELALGDLRQLLLPLASIAFALSALMSLVWVWITVRADPINDRQAEAYRGAWAGLFVTVLAAVGGEAWFMLWSRPLQAALQNPATLALSVGLTMAGVALAYYLGTVFSTRPAMAAAVPGAAVLHRLGRR